MTQVNCWWTCLSRWQYIMTQVNCWWTCLSRQQYIMTQVNYWWTCHSRQQYRTKVNCRWTCLSRQQYRTEVNCWWTCLYDGNIWQFSQLRVDLFFTVKYNIWQKWSFCLWVRHLSEKCLCHCADTNQLWKFCRRRLLLRTTLFDRGKKSVCISGQCLRTRCAQDRVEEDYPGQ